MENEFKDCRLCGGKIRWIKIKTEDGKLPKWEPCEIAGNQGMTLDGELTTVFQLHWGICMQNRKNKNHG